jgi:DNA-binding MarR family transcriptional regulator
MFATPIWLCEPTQTRKIIAMQYKLDDQVGFVLRQAQQRHAALFAGMMIDGLTPTQWAALAKLRECGAQSQNQLGRLTAMDGATIKGVIDRLNSRGLTASRPDPEDARRLLIELTEEGVSVYRRAEPVAREISEKTLAPLAPAERETLVALLRRIT